MNITASGKSNYKSVGSARFACFSIHPTTTTTTTWFNAETFPSLLPSYDNISISVTVFVSV